MKRSFFTVAAFLSIAAVAFLLIACGLLLVTAASASAQVPPPPCTSPMPQTAPPTFACLTGSNLTAMWDYTDAVIPGDVFRLYVGGMQVGPDLPARTATGVSVQFGAMLPPGTYTVAVSIMRPGASPSESARIPLTLIMAAPPLTQPPAPTNLRVVEIIMRGLDSAGLVLWEHTERMSAAVTP